MGKYAKTVILTLCVGVLLCILPGCRKKSPAQPGPAGKATFTEVETSLVIEPRVGVGQVKFGMTTRDVKHILGEASSATAGMLTYSKLGLAISFREGAATAVMCGDANNKDSELVKACRRRTKEGIGIGATEEEVIAAYGQPTARQPSQLLYRPLLARFAFAEGRVIGIWVQQPRQRR